MFPRFPEIPLHTKEVLTFMQYIKLQLGCLLVIAYVEITYIKAALQNRIPCNHLFDALDRKSVV